jgi:DnaJ like chaperone protein
MAKADGVVAADELKAFKEAFNVSPAEMKHAAPVFNSAKRDSANFEACGEQLVTVFKGNRKLLEDVLDGLFHIAKADEDVHRQEERFLAEVAKRFGFTATEFNSIKARHMVADKRNPYYVLGVEPSIGERRSSRATTANLSRTTMLNSSSHGLPREFVIIAVERRVALSDAYDAIVRERSV